MTQNLLICTDLDRTLIPNGPQPESDNARKYFLALCQRPEVTLVFVTGRHRMLIEQAVVDYCLPVPDYAIANVGTTIYRVGHEHLWQRQTGWDDEIAVDWGNQTHSDIKSILSDVPSLQLQENNKQDTHKLSYYVPLNSDRETLSSIITGRLAEHRVNARLIWSDDEPAGIGLLDVTPHRSSKYHAIKALMRVLDMYETQIVFAGDSGNDLEVIVSDIPSVLVANSQPQIREQSTRRAAESGHSDQLYLAKGGFMGMNGNYAAGILEGIAHYHPETIEWMGLAAGAHEK
ncbi:MAG: HAD-IIB family hydrolase [Gammaproteobacteria bacterium]|nr:HAD-IIB family hydrolase [Gammaproteobacteria bacterium]